MIRGVLLDVDGTLVLSNDTHAKAWVEAFKHFKYDAAFENVRPLIGMGGDKLIPKVMPGLVADSGTGKKISEYRTELFLDTYAPHLEPAPGSRALIQKLLQTGRKLAVASSATQKELSVLLNAAQVDDLLTEATTSDDADKSKPDPDIVHAALKKIALPASQVMMLGDTPYDIEAAQKTGVNMMAVRCGGWDDGSLTHAVAIYDDPKDILRNFDSSPFKERPS